MVKQEETHSFSENAPAVNTHSPPPHPDREPPSPPADESAEAKPPLAPAEPIPATKVNGFASGGDVEKSGGGGVWISRSNSSILGRWKKEVMVKRALLGFRVFGSFFCLISFSVMAADRNQGEAQESFDHWEEFRYCLSVNVIGFVYSFFQMCDLAYKLVIGEQTTQPHFRYYFDFAMDQIMAYLLVSASSSAATGVEYWKLLLGEDKFPDMASASVGLSFTAFVAQALTSLLSGYFICISLKYS